VSLTDGHYKQQGVEEGLNAEFVVGDPPTNAFNEGQLGAVSRNA